MLQKLTAQHVAAAPPPLPPYVRRDWLAAARRRFDAAALESGDDSAVVSDQTGAGLYGEIEFDSLALALEAVRALHGGMSLPAGEEFFVDIGSGSGLPVVVSAYLPMPGAHQLWTEEHADPRQP
jgi:hypothetical protein